MKEILQPTNASPPFMEDPDTKHKRLNDDFARRLKEYVELLKINTNNLKVNFMEKELNSDNFWFLQNQLRTHGFPESIFPELERNLKIDQPEFILNHKMQSQNEVLEVSPYFKMGDDGDKFFFNHYKATLKQSAEVPEDRTHKFYINDWKGATLREAFNLLKEVGPVHKNLFPDNGNGKKPWTALDLTQRTDTGNFKIITYPDFNLKKELFNYPIKELADDLKMDNLIKSLQRGNAQAVAMERPGGEETMLIRVNAPNRSVDLFNLTGEKMNEVLKAELGPKAKQEKDQVPQNKEGAKVDHTGEAMNADSKQKEELKKGAGDDLNSGRQNTTKNEKMNGKTHEVPGKTSNRKVKTEQIKDLLPQKENHGKRKGLAM